MAGDDHPDKKMVAAGDIKGKRKAIAEQVENQSTSDDETSDKTPAGAETSGSTATSCVKEPSSKKSKLDNNDQSEQPAPPSPSPPPAPVVQVPCPLCQRVFDSYPAMFGHQRVHKERTYRGAYPPPNFKREGSQRPRAEETEEAEQHVAEMLIELSKGRFEKPSTNNSIAQARGMSVDLNIPLEVEKSTEDEAEEATVMENVTLDLNKSPRGSE